MFLDLLKGLSVTFLHLFKKPSTISYPEQNLPTRPRPRGRHFLDRYEDGLEKCIGCSLCAAACQQCPVQQCGFARHLMEHLRLFSFWDRPLLFALPSY